MTGEPVDQDALVAELASDWLAGLAADDRDKGLGAARELVADWAREADPMPDPAAVVHYQREDLEATIAQSGGDRLRGLELELLKRRANHLSAATFQLATEVLDGKIGVDDSKRQGQAFLEKCEQMASDLDDYGSNPATDAIRQSLGESMLDALYAVERQAMSHRLAHSRPQANLDPTVSGGPPDIAPSASSQS